LSCFTEASWRPHPRVAAESWNL